MLSVQPLGRYWGHHCTGFSTSMCFWEIWEFHHTPSDFVESSTGRSVSQILIVGALSDLDRITVKWVTLHLWLTNCSLHAVKSVLICLVQKVFSDFLMIGVSIHPWNHGRINDLSWTLSTTLVVIRAWACWALFVAMLRSTVHLMWPMWPFRPRSVLRLSFCRLRYHNDCGAEETCSRDDDFVWLHLRTSNKI